MPEYAKCISSSDGTSLQEAVVSSTVTAVYLAGYRTAGFGAHKRVLGASTAQPVQSADGSARSPATY
jgi:hypothetical protein